MSGTEQAAGRDNADGGARRVIDTSVAHSARVHDYWLGGKDNFAADRAAGDAVIQAYPGIVASVRANRAFLARVVRFLAAEAGIRQFLDIGTGIPAANNIVDNDNPGGIISQLMAAVPAGSYLALSQVASDIEAEQMAEAARRYNRLARETQRHRSHAEVMRFFDGLELLEPGLVPVQRWRPASEIEASAHSAMWGGVGGKSGAELGA